MADARNKVRTFLLLTLALSSVFWYLIGSAGSLGTHGGLFLAALMWSPGIAALVTRVIYQRNLQGEGWQWGETRWQLVAYLLPIAYATIAYGSVWLFGLGGFKPFEPNLLTFSTLGTVQSSILALGEELGWRGLFVPELARLTDFTRTSLLSGVVWAFWHAPLIVFADYNSGTPAWYALTCFFVSVVAISFPFAWLRLRSGSVWTAVLMHASHNLWIQGFFDQVTIDTGRTRWLTTEFGAVLSIATLLFAFVFWRFRNSVGARRSPGVNSE